LVPTSDEDEYLYISCDGNKLLYTSDTEAVTCCDMNDKQIWSFEDTSLQLLIYSNSQVYDLHIFVQDLYVYIYLEPGCLVACEIENCIYHHSTGFLHYTSVLSNSVICWVCQMFNETYFQIINLSAFKTNSNSQVYDLHIFVQDLYVYIYLEPGCLVACVTYKYFIVISIITHCS
jgi:hypothetical protein